MAQAKRIMITLPGDLLASVDDLAAGRCSRSAFVREALRLLIRQRERTEANLQRLRRGYERMGRINLALAEEGLGGELETLETYERVLGGRESG
ncbi:MAG: CopG family ribbon-helix-helix protein [Patescibacteria group bacterium]